MIDTRNLEQRLKRLSWPVDRSGVWASIETRAGVEPWAIGDGGGPEVEDGAPAKARKLNLSLVLYASIAVVIVAAITVGSLEAVKHLGSGQPILVITDDTTAVSPGSTGQTAPSADEQPSAAMFRGNAARTGVYPSGGPTDQPGLLWEFKTGGGEGTSPVVADGVVYVAGEDGYLYALDARSGEEKWKSAWSAGSPEDCPTVSEGVVYIPGADGNFYALDAESGQELWRFPTGVYNVSSPAVSDGLVYLDTDEGYLYALDSESGQVKWVYLAKGRRQSPPGARDAGFSPAVSDGVVYFSYKDGYLYALDAQTGQEKWTVKPDSGYGPAACPAVSDGVVYFAVAGNWADYFYAFDAQTGQEKWTYEVDGAIRSSPAVSGGVVYLFHEVREDESWNAWVDEGRGTLVALDAATGKELWQFSAANNIAEWGWRRPWSSPSISGNVVYFGTADESGSRLHALDALTGEELWTWATSGSWRSSPAISDGVVYFSGVDGYLYALGSDQPTMGTADVTSSPSTTSYTTETPLEDASAAMFRGNAARSGVYPDGGPTDQPDLLWTFKTVGSDGTSPVVADGVVYVGGGYPTDSNDYHYLFYALDARSGKERWRFPWSYNGVMWNPPCPAVSEGVVYTRGADSYFYGLDAESGQELWRFPTGAINVSSPAVYDGLVYFGTDGGILYGLDAQSGQELWRFPTGDSKVSSPAVSDGLVYIGTHDRYLYALDAETGEERWTAEPDGPSRTTGSEPWSSPVVSDGVVYFGESGALGLLRALDAQTGEEKWTYVAGGMIHSSPAVSDGVVYLLSEGRGDERWPNGSGVLVALDATTGKELWQFAAANGSGGWVARPWSSPSISGTVVYFGTAYERSGSLHALDAVTGEELWTWVASGSWSSSPAISDGVVYFSGVDGYLYALE